MGLGKHSFYSLTFKYSLTTELWHCGPSIMDHGCGTWGSGKIFCGSGIRHNRYCNFYLSFLP